MSVCDSCNKFDHCIDRKVAEATTGPLIGCVNKDPITRAQLQEALAHRSRPVANRAGWTIDHILRMGGREATDTALDLLEALEDALAQVEALKGSKIAMENAYRKAACKMSRVQERQHATTAPLPADHVVVRRDVGWDDITTTQESLP